MVWIISTLLILWLILGLYQMVKGLEYGNEEDLQNWST